MCSGIFIATSRTNVSFIQPVNKRCRGVKLIVKKEWIEHNLISNIKEENSITNYLLKIETPYCDFKSIDSNSFALLKEIFSSSNQPFKKINIKANALKLMEILFNELIRQEALPYNEINFSDLSKVINLKNKFLTDFSKECPPLKTLSSYACMSESKFSKLFKQVL